MSDLLENNALSKAELHWGRYAYEACCVARQANVEIHFTERPVPNVTRPALPIYSHSDEESRWSCQRTGSEDQIQTVTHAGTCFACLSRGTSCPRRELGDRYWQKFMSRYSAALGSGTRRIASKVDKIQAVETFLHAVRVQQNWTIGSMERVHRRREPLKVENTQHANNRAT